MTTTAPQLLPYLERLLDGETVEWKTLGEVAELYTGLSGKNKEHFQKGNAPYVTYKNIFENLAVDSSILEMVSIGANEHQHAVQYGDVLITGSSENIEEVGMSSVVTFYPKTEIYLNSFSFGIRFHSSVQLSPEFTKYLFRSDLLRKQIMKTASGVTRFNVSKKKFSTIIIPLPPLRVQAHIVEILDKFTQLEAELEARNKQYDFYRNRLLDFAHRDDFAGQVEWKTLGEVAEYVRERVAVDQLCAQTYVGVDNLLPDRAGKQDSNYLPTEGNAIAYQPNDILIGNIRPYLKKIWKADNEGGASADVLVIRRTTRLLIPGYLYHLLADDRFFSYDMQHAKGAKMPRGNKEKILDYVLPLPPLSEQRRIVEILDRFDTLTNSISEGLPREITLRRKQYEYYRDALLRFPPPAPTA